MLFETIGQALGPQSMSLHELWIALVVVLLVDVIIVASVLIWNWRREVNIREEVVKNPEQIESASWVKFDKKKSVLMFRFKPTHRWYKKSEKGDIYLKKGQDEKVLNLLQKHNVTIFKEQ